MLCVITIFKDSFDMKVSTVCKVHLVIIHIYLLK